MILEHIDTLVAGDFPEIGKPTGIYFGHAGAVTAMACYFGWLRWPIRTLYYGQRLLYRLCLYDAHGERLALFDDIDYPINDVAIHPTLPLAAIAYGLYDGGMYFKGGLWIFNWEQKTAFSVLRSREVTRCRFSETGDELMMLLHPLSDDEFDWNLEKALDTFYGCTLSVNELYPAPSQEPLLRYPDPRLDRSTPTAPSTLGFDSGMVRQQTPGASVREWAAAHGKIFQERHHVWDMTWLPDGRQAFLHSGSLIEVVDIRDTPHTVWSVPKQVGSELRVDAFQLHYSPDNQELIVHVVDASPRDLAGWKSLLYRIGMSGDIKGCREFDTPFIFTWSADGSCLALKFKHREDEQGETAFLITPDGKMRPLCFAPYGAYHYIGLDGGKSLYFLQGKPPGKDKYLCSFDPIQDIWSFLWPIDEPDSTDGHATELAGCLIKETEVALAWKNYGSKPYEVFGGIACRELHSGRFIWQRPITAQAAAMAYMEAVNVIVCALVDGKLNIYNAATGSLLYSDEMIINDIPTIPMSLAVHENQVAVGTLDGRIVLYRFTADCG
ncbi:MAG: hypothetical protein ACYC6A_01585 [Armatimonadota bacterium]